MSRFDQFSTHLDATTDAASGLKRLLHNASSVELDGQSLSIAEVVAVAWYDTLPVAAALYSRLTRPT